MSYHELLVLHLFEDLKLTDLLHPGFVSGAECMLKRNKEISNEAIILVLGGKKCAISAQYTSCVESAFLIMKLAAGLRLDNIV